MSMFFRYREDDEWPLPTDEELAAIARRNDEQRERARLRRERDALLLKTGQRTANEKAAQTAWVLIQCREALLRVAATANEQDREPLRELADLVRRELGWPEEQQ